MDVLCSVGYSVVVTTATTTATRATLLMVLKGTLLIGIKMYSINIIVLKGTLLIVVKGILF